MARWFRRRPQWGLAAAMSLVATGLGALVASVVAMLVAASRVSSSPEGGHGTAALFADVSVVVSAWVWLAVVGGALMSGLLGALPHLWRHRGLQRAVGEVFAGRPRAGSGSGRVPVVVVDDAWPMAMGIPGRRAVILISAGLAERLSSRELAAVVAHEEAHLRWRHVAVSRLAGLLAVSMPRSTRARRLERWLGELVEYAADDAAARRVGATPLAQALHTLAELRDDVALARRAERVTALAGA